MGIGTTGPIISTVNPTVWRKQRQAVVALAKEGLVRTDLRYEHTPPLTPGEVAVALQDHLCSASQGPHSTVFQQALLYFICEGRHIYKGYSCCADVCHAILSLLGCRAERLVNRDDDNADGTIDADEETSRWKTQQNIAMLVDGAKQLEMWVPGTSKELPKPGDMMIIQVLSNGTRQHALNVRHVEEVQGTYTMHSVDGGQLDAGGQCLKRRKRGLIRKGRYWMVYNGAKEDRGVLGWIDLSKLGPYISAPGWSLPARS